MTETFQKLAKSTDSSRSPNLNQDKEKEKHSIVKKMLKIKVIEKILKET